MQDRPPDPTSGALTAAMPITDSDFAPRSRLRQLLPRRRLAAIALAVLVLLLLYYPVGGFLVNRVDDDAAFAPAQVPPNGSRAVALVAALIQRETIDHAWVANDPIFYPGWILDNTPEFQMGMMAACGRFATELADQLGRTRGSSQVDPALDKASGLLKYPGNVWIFDFSTSWAPTASSDSQYRAARTSLLDYNNRLSAGQASFERRADNLMATLERISADLGSSSAIVDRRIEEGSESWIDNRADNVFYGVKGRIYAYMLILRELGVDFEQLLREREVAGAWAQMLHSLGEAARLDPLVVMNGSTSGLFAANHLAVQGFYLLRARTQLAEITDILQK